MRRIGLILAVVVVGSLIAVTVAIASGSRSPLAKPTETPKPAAVLAYDPGPGATGVNPIAPIGVRVSSGSFAEVALRDGRRDEAVAQAKLAIAASAATARTPAFRFAEVATLLAVGRIADAASILGSLEKPLPRDPRVPYWRAQLAENDKPPAPSVAEKAYDEALSRDPSFVPASLALARLRLDQKRTQEALAVLKRAEAQGTPSVATSLSGPRDVVVNGVTGYLHEPGDVDGLTRSVSLLLGQPQRASMMGARARELVTVKFDPATLRAAWVNLWIDTAKAGQRAS